MQIILELIKGLRLVIRELRPFIYWILGFGYLLAYIWFQRDMFIILATILLTAADIVATIEGRPVYEIITPEGHVWRVTDADTNDTLQTDSDREATGDDTSGRQ